MNNDGLARLGSALAGWAERWMPDAFVFALLAAIIVFVAGLAFGTPAGDLVRFFGDGFLCHLQLHRFLGGFGPDFLRAPADAPHPAKE